jgi:hypothetical protein
MTPLIVFLKSGRNQDPIIYATTLNALIFLGVLELLVLLEFLRETVNEHQASFNRNMEK